MKNIRKIITDLNVARSNSCSKEKSEEIKKIINDLLPHEKQEKALEIIKDLFDFDFALRFPSNQPMLMITNKRTNEYWEIPITQEQYDILNGGLLCR